MRLPGRFKYDTFTFLLPEEPQTENRIQNRVISQSTKSSIRNRGSTPNHMNSRECRLNRKQRSLPKIAALQNSLARLGTCFSNDECCGMHAKVAAAALVLAPAGVGAMPVGASAPTGRRWMGYQKVHPPEANMSYYHGVDGTSWMPCNARG